MVWSPNDKEINAVLFFDIANGDSTRPAVSALPF